MALSALADGLYDTERLEGQKVDGLGCRQDGQMGYRYLNLAQRGVLDAGLFDSIVSIIISSCEPQHHQPRRSSPACDNQQIPLHKEVLGVPA